MGSLYNKVKASSLGGNKGVGGSLYERAQQIAEPDAITPVKPVEIPESMRSPLYLGDKTTISQAPEKKVPFGSLGKMAVAAFDTVKYAIDNSAEKFGDLLDSVPTNADEYRFNDNYETPTGKTLFMTPEERKSYYEGRKKATTGLNEALKLGEFGMSLVNFYPPIAAFNAELAAAKELPGPLAIPAHAVDLGFQKVSELGTKAMDFGINKLSENGTISPETADAIKPFAQELAGFATLMVGTHLGFKAMEKGLGGAKIDSTTGEKTYGGAMGKLPISDTAKDRINTGVALGTSLSMQPFSTAFGLAHSMITTKIEQRKAQGIEITPEEGKKIMTEVAEDLPVAHSDYLKENKVESFVPESSQLVDSTGKQDLRTVMTNLNEAGFDGKQIGDIMQKVIEKNNTGRFTPKEISDVARQFAPANAPLPPSKIYKGGKEITYNPRRPMAERPVVEEKAPAPEQRAPIAPEERSSRVDVAPKERTTRVSGDQLPVKSPEGEVRVSRLEARMKQQQDQISANRAEAEGISTYRQMNKAEQRRKAAEYVDANPEDAMAVLRGDKPAPEGLLHNSIAMAMEARATTEADANLAVKLGSLRATRQGQEISILTEADPTNVYSNIHEIIKARAAKAERTTKTESSKAVRSEISEGKEVVKQSRLKIEQAESLLEKILC